MLEERIVVDMEPTLAKKFIDKAYEEAGKIYEEDESVDIVK